METTNRVEQILLNVPASPAILNRFIAVLAEARSRIQFRDPTKALKSALARREYISPGYSLSEFSGVRLVFEIRDGVVKDIFAVPLLTKHVKDRLLERFGVSRNETLVKVALDIAKGRRLSHNEKRALGCREPGDEVVVNDDRVYLLRGINVVTVFTPNGK
jgi:hypothetical protein